MGGVLLKHRSQVTGTNVIFGEEGEPARLGNLALEALGFSVEGGTGREPRPRSEHRRRSGRQ